MQALDDGRPLVDDALRLATAAGCSHALVLGAARFDLPTLARLADGVILTDETG